MHLDQSRFPLVFLRAEGPPDAAVPDTPDLAFEAMLDRGAPFVLIGDVPPGAPQDELPEARKARALFFKKNKDRLRALCRGIVMIEGERPTPPPLRLIAQGIGKAYGAEVAFARDEGDAVAAGLALLAKDPRA